MTLLVFLGKPFASVASKIVESQDDILRHLLCDAYGLNGAHTTGFKVDQGSTFRNRMEEVMQLRLFNLQTLATCCIRAGYI